MLTLEQSEKLLDLFTEVILALKESKGQGSLKSVLRGTELISFVLSVTDTDEDLKEAIKNEPITH